MSPSNGEVQARRNLPISAGDEMKTEDPARAEVALADGNVLHVGGGTRIRFVSLSEQQGSDSDVSAIDLSDGSVILSVVGADDQAVPRIDTADATVYANNGARVRVNTDVRRGTGVVVRAGSVEVKTRSGSYTVRAGNYLLVQGDQEPEIARGSFSRDRFDLWASDRLEATYDAPQSASSRYVEEDYAADVQTLDGYGDWDYNSTYSSYVWRPQRRGRLVALLLRQLVLHADRPELVVVRPLGLVSLPLRQLVLRRRLEQLVLVSGLRLLAGLGLLGLHVELLRLVPDRLLRRLLPGGTPTTGTSAGAATTWPSRSTAGSRRARSTCAAGTSRA